jgi:hypothetical protein
MTTLFFAFAAALVATMLDGGINRFIFKRFASRETGRVGAFWLTAGFAAGYHFHALKSTDEPPLAISALLGTTLAVFLLWLWLFRTPAESVTAAG